MFEEKARDRELQVLFCLVLENLFYVHTNTAKDWYFICLFFICIQNAYTRTIFLAYKRTITEESNNRLIWSLFGFETVILPSYIAHVLLFCSTLWNISTSAIFCFILVYLRPSPFYVVCNICPAPLFRIKRKITVAWVNLNKHKNKTREVWTFYIHSHTHTHTPPQQQNNIRFFNIALTKRSSRVGGATING